jgi:hypothetical protein
MNAVVNQSRIRISRSVLSIVLWLLVIQPVLAAPFSTDGITLDIPAGFEGPVTQNNMDGRAFGYSKQSLAPGIRTLLQITIVDPGNNANPATLTKEELSQGAEKYVLDFLQSVERSRTEFKKGNVAHLVLGGIPAAKISWQGNAQGIATNGIMYCVIVGGNVVLLHTQDAGNKATGNMREAIGAFEKFKIK